MRGSNLAKIGRMEQIQSDVFAMFRDHEDVQVAVQRLQGAGFDSSRIHSLEPSDFKFDVADSRFELHTLILAGAVTGAVIGLVCGITCGTLAFYALSLVNQQLMNHFALVTIFSILGLLLGAASGTLIGIGVPETQLKRYARYLGEGGTLVYVRVLYKQQRSLAQNVLLGARGFEISFRNESATLNRVFQGWRYIKPL
jgi:hypothetical protein